MTNRTRKEFAEYLKMDVKKLADKIRYQEQKHHINFGTDFEDTKIYTEQEQYEICNLLDIPCFHVEVHPELENDLLSEKHREQLKTQMKQLSELFSLIEDANFLKLDGEFKYNLLKNLGQDYVEWAKINKNVNYQFEYEKLDMISEYLAQRG